MTTVMSDRLITTFKDLRVWQEGIELVKAIYILSGKLPKEERYGLASQMKRAAISVPSNIAEGHARKHRAEYRQSVYVAVGSLAELETQVDIATQIGLLSEQEIASALERIGRLRGMLITLGRKLI